MKKRILSTVTMLLMLTVLVMGPLDVRAVTTTNGWTLEMSSSTQSLTVGDIVTVTVKLNGGSRDIKDITGYLNYDAEVFYPPWVTSGDPNNTYLYYDNYTATGTTVVSLSKNTSGRPSGDLFTASFSVKKAANETTIWFQNVMVKNYNPYWEDNAGSTSVKITNAKSKKIVLSTSDVSGSSYVTIPVSLAVNEGWRTLAMNACYDATKLQFSSVSIDSAINAKVAIGESTTAQNGSVTTNFAVRPEIIEDIKNTGTLFYYTFRILPTSNTSTGTSSSGTASGIVNPVNTEVTFSISSVTDWNQNESFYLTTARSIVTMNGGLRITGDVNGNGKIDLVDVLYIVQYYNKVRTLTSVEFSLADVDKNGVVNLVDAKKILRYYNGETSTF